MARLLRVGIWCGVASLTVAGLRAADEVQKLGPVSVSARVPLVKVGDYQLREERFGATAVADGDYIYVIGGANNANTRLDSVERFNVRTHQSENFAKLITGRCWVRAVFHRGKIYVLGGDSGAVRGATTVEDTVEIIDVATRKVTRGADLPEPRAHFGCALLDGKIYVIGGVRQIGPGRNASGRMMIYDIATNQWTDGVPLPTPRSGMATVVGDFIIVAGGYNGVREFAEVEVFNPRQRTWRTLPPLAKLVSGNSAAFLGRHLFLVGDFDALDEIVAYDLTTKTSEVFTLGFRNARHSAAVVHEEKLYVMGGKLAFPSALDFVQVFELPKKEAAAPAK